MPRRKETLTFEGKWLLSLGFGYFGLGFGIFMASGCPQRIMEAMQ